jgi:hypothetical protein
MTFRRILIASLSFVLVACVVFVGVGAALAPTQRFLGTLKHLLPRADDLPHWSLTYSPVAETAEMQRAVGEILNFDDAVHAIYTSGDMHVAIYAAYWSPGKMSHRLVAGHTPDVCWVGGGWTPQVLPKSVDYSVAGLGTLPLEHRVYRLRERTEHVVFCHLIGGKAMSYGTAGLPPWYAAFSDLFTKGMRQREEQFFVRISSNRPWEEFQETPPVRIFVPRLLVELDKMLRGSK